MSDFQASAHPKSVGINLLNELQMPQPWSWSYNDERTIIYLQQKDGYIFDNLVQRKPIGEADVGDIVAGVLEITPEMGEHVTLTGHGAADFTITGFGNACPRGYVFSLYIPRTIGTGVANALGHYVDFDHAAAGEGLDLTITRYQNGINSVYGYTAYPDACDVATYPAALFERLVFIHEGEGRWRLAKMPEPASGYNTNGYWERCADGTMRTWLWTSENIAITTASGYGGFYGLATSLPFPASFAASPVVSAISGSTAVSADMYSETAAAVVIMLRTIASSAIAARVFGYSAAGRWK